MEAHISFCVLQFLIRQEYFSDGKLNDVISSLPIEAEDPRIRRELLIRGIMSNISEGDLTESMLDSFESLEKIDREEGGYIAASMKRAYCGVALDCTVRYLGRLAFDRGNYLQAVERIWRGRIRGLESRNSELVTDELKGVMDDIEGAVWDVNVRKRLLGKSTRRDALKLCEVYLTEALTIMGPPLLELVPETHVKKRRRVAQDGQDGKDSRDEVLLDLFGVEAEEEVAVENGGENVMAEHNQGEDNQNEVAGTRGLDELEAIVVEDEGDNKGDDVAKEDPIVMQSPCSNHEPAGGFGGDDNIVVENPILAQPAHSNEEQDEQIHCGGNGAEAENIHNSLYNAGEDSTRKASEIEAENPKAKLFPEVAPRSKYDTLTTPAVCKLVESLRASSSALGKMVVDPLPDALRKATEVQSEIAQDEHGSPGQAVDNEQRPTLMKPNATASTFEWDSLDASQPKPHLDEPRRETVSSLPKFSKRRAWTVEEEDALREGVTKYGRGNWKIILENNNAALGLRSTVDLKDKWRNMTRSPCPWLR